MYPHARVQGSGQPTRNKWMITICCSLFVPSCVEEHLPLNPGHFPPRAVKPFTRRITNIKVGKHRPEDTPKLQASYAVHVSFLTAWSFRGHTDTTEGKPPDSYPSSSQPLPLQKGKADQQLAQQPLYIKNNAQPDQHVCRPRPTKVLEKTAFAFMLIVFHTQPRKSYCKQAAAPGAGATPRRAAGCPTGHSRVLG